MPCRIRIIVGFRNKMTSYGDPGFDLRHSNQQNWWEPFEGSCPCHSTGDSYFTRFETVASSHWRYDSLSTLTNSTSRHLKNARFIIVLLIVPQCNSQRKSRSYLQLQNNKYRNCSEKHSIFWKSFWFFCSYAKFCCQLRYRIFSCEYKRFKRLDSYSLTSVSMLWNLVCCIQCLKLMCNMKWAHSKHTAGQR